MIDLELAEALSLLHPGASFVVRGSQLEWYDTEIPRPSDEEIAEARALLKEEKEANEYKEKRKQAYPKMDELIELLFEAMDSGELPKANKFYQAIKKIRDDNPKPPKRDR